MWRSGKIALISIGLAASMVVLLYHVEFGVRLPRKALHVTSLITSCVKTNMKSTSGHQHIEPSKKKPHCRVHNYTEQMESNFDCVPLKVQRPVSICVFTEKEDNDISKNIRSKGLFEPEKAMYIDKLVRAYGDYGFIDIGANIGQYSLIAASAGRRVVAVEPMIESIRRFHKSVTLGGWQGRVTLVTNAVSNIRTNVTLHVRPGNKGGTFVEQTGAVHQWQNAGCVGVCKYNVSTVLLNDLLEVIRFKKALLKIDIEGFERLAFQHADRLFDEVDIPLVFMEWVFYTRNFFKKEHEKDVRDLLASMTKRHYVPYAGYDRKFVHKLLMDTRVHWLGWPGDIVWRKEIW